MAVQGFLGKHECTIHFHFKHPIGTGNEFYFDIRKCSLDLGRRTGSPRFVVSNRTIFDRNPHSSSTNGMLLKLGQWLNRNHRPHVATNEDQRARR